VNEKPNSTISMPDEPEITTAAPSDATAIFNLQRLAYQSEAELYNDWSIPPLQESLEQLQSEFNRQIFLKAVDKKTSTLVGSVRARTQDGVCSVGRLIVHPSHQGRGIGSALLRAIEQHCAQARRFELFTGNRSRRNLSLYQRLDYAPFKELKLSGNVTLVFLEKIVEQPSHPFLPCA
jgi:ribosomal protein S18 acetylase RimI-like enzyme